MPENVFACCSTLVDISSGPGWDGNYDENFHQKKQAAYEVREIIRSSNVVLHITPLQAIYTYLLIRKHHEEYERDEILDREQSIEESQHKLRLILESDLVSLNNQYVYFIYESISLLQDLEIPPDFLEKITALNYSLAHSSSLASNADTLVVQNPSEFQRTTVKYKNTNGYTPPRILDLCAFANRKYS